MKLFPEDFSIREVAGLMAEARIVVGPQGAQWANTIFCSPEMRAIQFNESMLSASFLNLAELVGYDLSFVFGDASRSARGQTIADNVANSTRKNFSIDVGLFAEKVEQLCSSG